MSRYIKPTINTKFYIDFNWWRKNRQNLSGYLQNHICPDAEYQVNYNRESTYDWINPETGEVFQIPTIWYTLREYCVDDDSFIDEYTPLTSAVFRAFIVNNNVPLTPVELYNIIQKQSPEIILRTIGGNVVQEGIRPIQLFKS